MQTNSIPGVKNSICAAEQFIAYNIASVYSENEYTAEQLVQMFYPKSLKYNSDAVLLALKNGLPKYREHRFIATSYKQVGDVFTLK